MIDITHKHNSLRYARASGIVKCSKVETLDAIENGTVPKGNVLEAARSAGLFGVKRTADIIPDCHPLPVEYAAVHYTLDRDALEIGIEMEVKTVYKTGVEVEAMHGVSVVALTIYDMLKPIDKGIEIRSIRLEEKTGGKSDFLERTRRHFNAAIIICSDSISKGHKEDKAGDAIRQRLEAKGVEVASYGVVPDEIEDIQAAVRQAAARDIDLILLSGGTGLSPRDVSPEAIRPLLDTEIPGIAEHMRSYGMDRTPLAMFSRSVSGVMDKSLILTLPGSTKGAAESMDAVFPSVLHLFKIFRGERHD